MQNMKFCKLCRKSVEKLAEAHVIPRSFYKEVRGDGKASHMIEVYPDRVDIKHFQNGVKDLNLNCLECESKFQKYDTHGFNVRSRFLDAPVMDKCDELDVFRLDWADYESFKMFILLNTWRIGASEELYFKNVKLGEHEKRLSKMLMGGDVDGDDDFCFALNFIKDTPNKMIHRPQIVYFPGSDDGGHPRRCLWFDLNKVNVIVKLDRRPINSKFRKVFSRRSVELFITTLDYKGSFYQGMFDEFHRANFNAKEAMQRNVGD